MMKKESFLEKNGITEKYRALERRNPNLWTELLEIGKKHDESIPFLEASLQGFINSIGYSDHIHSIRYRVKNTESLLVKIIEKKFENADQYSKYNGINADNYYKIITDLIGVRIIVRYRYEWQEIHRLVWEKYNKANINYLVDYEKDYKSKEGVFIAEKPIVYYRHGETKKNYEVFGRDIFEIKLSDIGYSSIHYIINVNGNYIELQVRTIYDEAWSECDHDFVYKLNAGPKKLVLQRCSRLLSDITGAADGLSSFMRDYFTEDVFNDRVSDEEETAQEQPENLPMDESVYKKTSMNIDKVSDVLELF